MLEEIDHILNKLESHLISTDYKGYDPFDALNSPILSFLSFNSRFLGIFFLQSLKKNPINLRPLILIKKQINPKGFGLLISSYVLKYKCYREKNDLDKAKYFADWLIDNYSRGYSGYCWGYNFDWPNRNAFFPKGLPTIVNTSFIANGFLDLFETTKDNEYLKIAQSACKFIEKDLKRHIENDTFCFSYTPSDNTCIHNANMLGANLLARVGYLSKKEKYRDLAYKSMQFSINHHNDDGSWNYGEGNKQKWIDSFHTGYNLLALNNYIKYSGKKNFEYNLIKGYEYYVHNFFTDIGEVKYFHNATYPLDCHAFAHSTITLTLLKDLSDKSEKILKKMLRKTLEIFWNEDTGYFYYRKNKWLLNRVDYVRWVQIWVFYAFLIYKHNS